MKVYPVDGRIVRDPVTGRVVPVRGLEVPETDSFWIRRLADGDVTKTPPEVSDQEGGE